MGWRDHLPKMPEPKLPTWDDVKQGAAAVYDDLRHGPDPIAQVDNLTNAVKNGDYAGALEQGFGLPGVGMIVKPYDMHRLQGAHELRSAGAHPNEIWGKTQTGDFGAGFRQEIGDNGATLNAAAIPNRMTYPERFDLLRGANPDAPFTDLHQGAHVSAALDRTPFSVSLGDVMRHQPLFEAEPGLAQMQVRQGPGGFDPHGMTVDPRLAAEHQRLSVLGNLQRYLQEAEGQPGMTAQALRDSYPPGVGNDAFFAAQANRATGNQLPKAVERRANMSPEQRANRSPEMDMDMPLNQQINTRVVR